MHTRHIHKHNTCTYYAQHLVAWADKPVYMFSWIEGIGSARSNGIGVSLWRVTAKNTRNTDCLLDYRHSNWHHCTLKGWFQIQIHEKFWSFPAPHQWWICIEVHLSMDPLHQTMWGPSIKIAQCSWCFWSSHQTWCKQAMSSWVIDMLITRWLREFHTRQETTHTLSKISTPSPLGRWPPCFTCSSQNRLYFTAAWEISFWHNLCMHWWSLRGSHVFDSQLQ